MATHTRLPPGSSDAQPVHRLCVQPWRSSLDGAPCPQCVLNCSQRCQRPLSSHTSISLHLSREQPGGQCGHPPGVTLSGLSDLQSPICLGHSSPPQEAFPALGSLYSLTAELREGSLTGHTRPSCPCSDGPGCTESGGGSHPASEEEADVSAGCGASSACRRLGVRAQSLTRCDNACGQHSTNTLPLICVTSAEPFPQRPPPGAVPCSLVTCRWDPTVPGCSPPPSRAPEHGACV